MVPPHHQGPHPGAYAITGLFRWRPVTRISHQTYVIVKAPCAWNPEHPDHPLESAVRKGRSVIRCRCPTLRRVIYQIDPLKEE